MESESEMESEWGVGWRVRVKWRVSGGLDGE